MTLALGTRVGSYEIVALLGAGGMGEVYRARDAKLNRDVALKVLPELFTADPDRLARFRREAQVLGSLNHPNIGHIYGFDDSGDTQALVLELVDGPTLAERIEQGPMPLDETLPIARQIADALECAHEQGIVHRDLKPANIKVRADGTVKVLDFGLAKAFDPATSSGEVLNSPTLTARATQLGVIIGTAAYMAPEQARGRAVDRRADIWAFGVILFEMLTGRRAFEGDDISITLASVLKDDPKWSELPADLSPSVRRVLRRCLEKDPKRRLSAIGDARLELEEAHEPSVPVQAPAQARGRGWQQAVPWVMAAVVTAMLTSVALWAPWRRPAVRTPVRISADVGVEGALAVNIGTAAVISPDGQTAVFVVLSGGRNMLYVRSLDQLHSSLLQGTEEAHSPFFSPDSQSIGFFTPGKLKKISVAGGAAVTLCDALNGRGGSWGTDGTIIFQPTTAAGGVLHRVSDAGGAPAPVGKQVPGEVTQRWPQLLPGGKGVIYSSNSVTIAWDTGTVMAQPLPSGEPKVLVRAAFHARYVNSGHLLFVRDGTLFSVPFDSDRLEIRGSASPIVENVLTAVNTGGAQFSVSEAGTLLYVPGRSAGTELPVTWLDRTGKATVLRAEPAEWSFPSFSPDGRQLAMAIGLGVGTDIWTYDWTRDTPTKLTFGAGLDLAPVWTPDGRRIAYASASETSPITNLYWKRSDGSGDAQRLTDSPNVQVPFSFHPSGKYLAYSERRPETSLDIMMLPLEGDEKSGWKPGSPTAFISTAATENSPVFSPDGRWVAYSSTESGVPEIYVRPFPQGEGKWKISTPPGGMNPIWSRARRELFYAGPVSGNVAVMSVEYEAEGNSFRAARARQWFPSLIVATRPFRPFDVHPDGERIAIAKPPDAVQAQQRPVFVFDFFEELRRTSRPRGSVSMTLGLTTTASSNPKRLSHEEAFASPGRFQDALRLAQVHPKPR